MLGLAPGSAALRSVKLRGAGDALRARHAFERAVAGVDWMPPALASDAILLVRRLAHAIDPAQQRPFGERVSVELRRHAERARRPWLHDDAAGADAVLFADQAELVACLVRDWLRGVASQRWWWRAVLADADPYAWIRREALVRGDLLVPAIAMLARVGDAVAFTARMEPSHVDEAIAAVARAHAVSVFSRDEERALPNSRDAPSPRIAGEAAAGEEAEPIETIRGLEREIPEAFAPVVSAPQRRLLLLTLALARVPRFARSKRFTRALAALERWRPSSPAMEILPGPIDAEITPHAKVRRSRRRERPQRIDIGERAPEPHATGMRQPDEQPDTRPMQPSLATGIGLERGEPATATPPLPTDAPQPRVAEPIDHAIEKTRESAALPDPGNDASPTAAIHHDPPVRAPQAARPSPERAPRVATSFGGLFYLLNAALELELYADFTAPLANNLELSPWDWLALVGREWFGDELREDAVWGLLAELAGRVPEEEPDRAFDPPSSDWLVEHLRTLRVRLALAIDAQDGDDVPRVVCRHAAQVEVSATVVHVHLALRDLPLVIRIAGLDRDTGWIPAAGRAVCFHFD